MVRTSRNFLPVVANPDHPYVKGKQQFLSNMPYYSAAYLGFTSFAIWQLSKAYYPYGIILRSSIPTTPALQFSYKAPIVAVFAGFWWFIREKGRSDYSDLTCDTEN